MAIKLKRGTTESWALGPELVDFGQSSTKGKDSIIRAEGTELEMYVYTTSANEWWTKSPSMGGQSTGKIPGLPIYVNGEREPGQATGEGAARCTLKIYFEAPADCTLEYINGVGGLYRPQFTNYEYIDTNYQQGSGNFPELFIKWPAEKVGTAEPVPIKIRVSLRENWLCEELEEGQLGLEYTEDGNVKLKAGMPGISKWDELPYIGNDGGTSIQSNWNQWDEQAADYIQNKPFGIIPAGYNILGDKFTFNYQGQATLPYLNLMENEQYHIHLTHIEDLETTINHTYSITARRNDNGELYLKEETIYDGGGEYTLVIEITNNGNIQLGGYPVNRPTRFEWYPDGIYEISIINPHDSHIKPLDLKFIPQVEQISIAINEALDRIIAIQNELIGVTLITFTIDGTEYQAEEGMTWGEWIGSKYDVDGFNTIFIADPEAFNIEGNYAVSLNGSFLVTLDPWRYFEPHQIIDPTLAYALD